MQQSLVAYIHALLDAFTALLTWLSGLLWTEILVLDGGRKVRIVKQLAEGGFGYVFLAQDRRTGEAFALKRMLCQTQEQLYAVKREMLYHREFQHPNLLPLIDTHVQQQHRPQSGSTGIYVYLLFPYLSGGSLRDEIDRRILSPLSRRGMPGAWPEDRLIRLFRDILLGVRHLHEHEPAFAHRDIKPENVLLKADGLTPVLIDFGSMTMADRTVGARAEALMVQEEAAQHSTLPYRAPELFDVTSNATLDARVDVWALGCLLFALMFGYSPFEVEFEEPGGRHAGGPGEGQGGSRPRVVECTFLRVIGKVPFPTKHAYSTRLVETVEWILEQNPRRRPHVTEVLGRVEQLMSKTEGAAEIVAHEDWRDIEAGRVAFSAGSKLKGKEQVAVELASLTGGGAWR
ncbi:hypothetical protein NSK_007643 [Nannochloropsis salina CCMP1776]|jgi:serine/threonine kinase 16|uniref:non-specific serine/threonine protein kinase n=1 Tax=Nannochloropsis salina CCMP1776 TaxID=1027361 RepID=A0A4D9CPE5_9STRA|nr:hypothetical protein NSK_007643 [Nannochloropsis salina CCMP1776]|eukprot:TFJ81000.1 hypothetical protein NSK_007643 [Nannochloropsis salina CCMP1776]